MHASKTMSTLTIYFFTIIYTIYAQPYYRIGRYERYDNPSITVAYPLSQCTKDGDKDTSEYILYQCTVPGDGIWGPCKFTSFEIGKNCTIGSGFQCTFEQTSDGLVIPSPTGETCNASAQPTPQLTTTQNYVQIQNSCGLFKGTTFSPSDCPHTTLYTDIGTIRLTTNICVDQGDGSYLMLSKLKKNNILSYTLTDTLSIYINLGQHVIVQVQK